MGEVHGGLACGICTADNVDVFIFVGRGFGVGSAVVDACAGEAIHAGDIQATPLHAGGNDYAVAKEFLAGGKFYDAIFALDAEGFGLDRRQDFSAEAFDLGDAAAGEVGSAETGGKAEIVFDAGAEAGLATGGFTLDKNRAQAFGAAIESACQAGGTRADDDDIVKIARGGGREAEFRGDVGERGFLQDGAVRKNHDREIGGRISDSGADTRIGTGAGLNPAIRDLAFG